MVEIQLALAVVAVLGSIVAVILVVAALIKGGKDG